MEKLKRNPQTLIFLSFIVVSAILGCLIPGFTDWTGTQQSKRSPLIFQFAIGFTLGGIALCLLLPWLPIASQRRESAQRRPIKFSLQKVLATTAAVAIWMAMFVKFQLAGSILICIGTFAWLIWFVAHNRQDRWPVAAFDLPLSSVT